MEKWINKLFEATKQYTVVDFGFLKLCLISIGILFGVYFSQFFSSYLSIVWIIFIVSYIFIMYKTFVKYYKK